MLGAEAGDHGKSLVVLTGPAAATPLALFFLRGGAAEVLHSPHSFPLLGESPKFG